MTNEPISPYEDTKMIPDYLDKSHDKIIKNSIEWKKNPTKKVMIRNMKYVDVIVLDSGTWMPVRVETDNSFTWRITWYNNIYSIKIPMWIRSYDKHSVDIQREDLIKVVLPRFNDQMDLSFLEYGATMISFFIYLITDQFVNKFCQ